jgi:uncharacterized protein (DUF433 family)
MIELADGEDPVDGFPYLCRMKKRCGGRVTVSGSRMEPKYVVFHVNQNGVDWFRENWSYISNEAIADCFKYIEKYPEEGFDYSNS